MNDDEVVSYLLSHAPLERFYLIEPPGADAALLMYLDSDGRPWCIMEDDDETVERAADFLKRAGVAVFIDYDAATKYEQEVASRSTKAATHFPQ
jgi:hypothetical protein